MVKHPLYVRGSNLQTSKIRLNICSIADNVGFIIKMAKVTINQQYGLFGDGICMIPHISEINQKVHELREFLIKWVDEYELLV